MSTSLRGLARAVGADPQNDAQPFDPSTDPLGLGLMARARQNRFTDDVKSMQSNPMAPAVGPLPDPNWDAYFEALRSAGQGKPVTLAGGRGPGLGDNANDMTVGAEVYGPRRLRRYPAGSS